jgi:Asp/Glu/hydantoin racemase
VEYWTNPTTDPAFAIISTPLQIEQTAHQCLSFLGPILSSYSGFLIAGFADLPLVPLLQAYLERTKPVVGIYQASLTVALQLLSPGSKFAILTTGKQYEGLLKESVRKFLGASGDNPTMERLGEVAATEIKVEELSNAEVVRKKVTQATRKVLTEDDDIGVILLGGVLLLDVEEYVREICVEILGKDRGQKIRIVDQLLAGVVTLDGLIRIQRASEY